MTEPIRKNLQNGESCLTLQYWWNSAAMVVEMIGWLSDTGSDTFYNYKVSYSHFSFNWKQGSGKFPKPDPDWMPVIIFILCWFVSTPSTFYIVFDMINWKRQNWTKTGQELWLLKTLLYKLTNLEAAQSPLAMSLLQEPVNTIFLLNQLWKGFFK